MNSCQNNNQLDAPGEMYFLHYICACEPLTPTSPFPAPPLIFRCGSSESSLATSWAASNHSSTFPLRQPNQRSLYPLSMTVATKGRNARCKNRPFRLPQMVRVPSYVNPHGAVRVCIDSKVKIAVARNDGSASMPVSRLQAQGLESLREWTEL